MSDGRDDFDFLVGKWRIHHKRLRTRLAQDTQWDAFAGSCEMHKILGGLGNMDDNVLELPGGTYRAATVRQFDPEARRWSIWWIDARRHGIGAPVHGSFADGVGTFLGDDVLDGNPIRVRFIWSGITPTACRWEQAFSPDGGATWETNWIMSFDRVASSPESTPVELFTFARFHARAGQEEEVAAAIRDGVGASRAEPGCRAIAAYRSIRDPLLFWIHSRWIDEAAFEIHAGMPHTVRFLERVQPLIDHPLDVTRTRPIV